VLLPDQILVEGEDHLEVVVAQVVLRIGGEGGAEEHIFLLDVAELQNQAFPHGFSRTQLVKGFMQKPVEVPVDEIVFVAEAAVERLSGKSALLTDLADGDAFHGCGAHALPAGLRQFQLCRFICSLTCFHASILALLGRNGGDAARLSWRSSLQSGPLDHLVRKII